MVGVVDQRLRRVHDVRQARLLRSLDFIAIRHVGTVVGLPLLKFFRLHHHEPVAQQPRVADLIRGVLPDLHVLVDLQVHFHLLRIGHVLGIGRHLADDRPRQVNIAALEQPARIGEFDRDVVHRLEHVRHLAKEDDQPRDQRQPDEQENPRHKFFAFFSVHNFTW